MGELRTVILTVLQRETVSHLTGGKGSHISMQMESR